MKSSQIKSNQINSYTPILGTENGNKGNDYSIIIVIIIVINIVSQSTALCVTSHINTQITSYDIIINLT